MKPCKQTYGPGSLVLPIQACMNILLWNIAGDLYKIPGYHHHYFSQLNIYVHSYSRNSLGYKLK